MDTCELVAAKIEISEIAAKYGHYCDHRDWDSVVELFAEDGVFDASKVYDKVWTGHVELHEFYDSAPDVVAHHPAGIFTDVQDDTTAVSTVKFLVVWKRQIFSVDYAWRLVKVDGHWRIGRQVIEVIGKARFTEPATAR